MTLVVKPQPNNRSVIGLYAVNYYKTVRCNYIQNKIYITPRPEVLKEQQLINVFEKHPCDKITVIEVANVIRYLAIVHTGTESVVL